MHYFLINKPYGMLSQFTREGKHLALVDFDFNFPKDVYPVGRLDHDSEGLLLLTNDNYLKTTLLEPKYKREKVYWAQVDGDITEQAIAQLKAGVKIKHKGKNYQTIPCLADKINPPAIPERNPPIRFRKSIPTSWIELTIVEGKNRQVRKMTAAVGFPTLRLLRVGIGGLAINHLGDKDLATFTQKEIYNILGIK